MNLHFERKKLTISQTSKFFRLKIWNYPIIFLKNQRPVPPIPPPARQKETEAVLSYQLFPLKNL